MATEKDNRCDNCERLSASILKIQGFASLITNPRYCDVDKVSKQALVNRVAAFEEYVALVTSGDPHSTEKILDRLLSVTTTIED